MYNNSNARRAGEWNGLAADALNALRPLQASMANWLNDGGEVQLVHVHRIRRLKIVAEFDIVSHGAGNRRSRRCIGKTYADHRGRQIFDTQRLLWDRGFGLPSSLTVACPIAYIDAAKLFVQEKAPGSTVKDLVFKTGHAPLRAVGAVARWLAKFHTVPVETSPRLPVVRARLLRYGAELVQALPAHAKRIEYLAGESLRRIDDTTFHASWVPSHGDLHLANVYVARGGRVTAIDLDTFGLQEREADVGYFLGQTAIMGYLSYCRSFAETRAVRDHFLEAYQNSAGALRRDRIGLYVAHTFLQSLHYEICVMKNDKQEIIEPWLRNAVQGLETGLLSHFSEPANITGDTARCFQRSVQAGK